jgi:CheY-like chemotaxis protein
MKTILIAEDEFAVLRVLALLLAAEGFEVVTAGDGEEAFERLCGLSGCVVVLADVSMPRLGGAGLVARMQASSTLASVPVVLMAHAHERISLPGVTLLAKPVRLAELLAVLARLPEGTS